MRVYGHHLYCTGREGKGGGGQAIGKKKSLERLCKQMINFPLLRSFVSYHIHFEVK